VSPGVSVSMKPRPMRVLRMMVHVGRETAERMRQMKPSTLNRNKGRTMNHQTPEFEGESLPFLS
jgi:hypothetical protein